MKRLPGQQRGIGARFRRLRTASASERREWLFALALLTAARLVLAVSVACSFFVEQYASSMTGSVKGLG